MQSSEFIFEAIEYVNRDGVWDINKANNFIQPLTNSQLYRLSRLYTTVQDFDVNVIRINTECHHRCVHCFISERENNKHINVSYDEIIERIKKNKNNKVIIFTGGEPFFHPDFKRILEYSKREGFIVSVESNIPTFEDTEIAKEYASLIDMLVVPIHSVHEEVYESVTQIKGSYKRHRTAIKNVQDYMPNTGISFVSILIKPILETLYETIEAYSKEFPGAIFFTGASCLSGPSNSADVSPSYTEIKPVLENVLRDFGKMITVLYIPLCFLYPYINEIHIGEEDNIVLDGLDILDNNPTDVFYYSKGLSSKIARCKDCYLKDICQGIIKGYDKLYTPDKEIKPITHESYEKSDLGNCDHCGIELTNEKVEIFSHLKYPKGEQKYETKKTLCPKCYKAFVDKLFYIALNPYLKRREK